MAHRLRTNEGHALYMRRGATVEPVIANLNKILIGSSGVDYDKRQANCISPPLPTTSPGSTGSYLPDGRRIHYTDKCQSRPHRFCNKLYGECRRNNASA
jgi:hypothetical protein